MNPILYEDEQWLAVDKPTGISTHGAFPGDVAMQEWLDLHLSRHTFVCSRLDKGTSGVLLLAKTAEASGRAQRIHEDDSSEKEYVFVSAARSKEREWTCAESLDGLSASTRFRFVRELAGRYLYAAVISRGRTHQIRRHAAVSQVPIAGDSEYGGVADKRLFLHCHKVRWPEISSVIESPIPESFVTAETLLRDVNSALERRGNWLLQVTNAWRMVHRGELSLDCAIDCYGAYALVWDYSNNFSDQELSEMLRPVMALVLSKFQLSGWVLKRAKRNPHGNRLVQTQIIFGEQPPATFEVTEHNLRYRVTLTEAQHVGLFLDQRDNRKMVFDFASGMRVANLFAYTCSFSTVAAAGGAEVVFSVDVARKYLDQGCANFDLNGLVESRRGKFIAEDVRSWLARQKRKVERDGEGARLGIVICDPPTFSTTQTDGEFSVEEEWLDLAKDCSFLLKRGGFAFFSTNHRAGERSNYEAALRKVFSSVERRSPPMDFPTLPGEPEHVKLFVCRTS
jgi:23S rRNA G2069 N7-methylase RlmK/C1962 C5-methylase RlmI